MCWSCMFSLFCTRRDSMEQVPLRHMSCVFEIRALSFPCNILKPKRLFIVPRNNTRRTCMIGLDQRLPLGCTQTKIHSRHAVVVFFFFTSRTCLLCETAP
jgi:hypothetical protein